MFNPIDIDSLLHPQIHVLRDESVPRDQVITVSAEAGGPAILANSWMIIELRMKMRRGRRIDPDLWLAEILAKIEADAEKAMTMALYDMAWDYAENTARLVGKGWAEW